MRNDRNVLHEKQHEMHSLVGRTPCSYGQNRKEQVVLIRCRIGHSRLTHSYLNGMYSMKFQLFTKTFMLIDCVDVTDIRQTFYNVNFISDIFTNVAGDTIFLNFFKRN